MKVPLFRPKLGKEELVNLKKVFKTGWVGLGPMTKELEERFAKSIGVKHANGATSVFADVDPISICLDPADFERKITKRTKVVMPVHLGGHSCDMDAILKIAKKHGIFVVEDCANAQGASYKGKMVGSFG